jgi:hypothetical protein
MNRNFIFASLGLAVAVNIAIIGCHRKGDRETASNDTTAAPATAMTDSINAAAPSRNPYENSVLEIRTFTNNEAQGGFGYDVYIDSSLYVHQPHIPAVAGKRGFSTAENAKRTGEYVAYKIKHNIMPPSVNPKELDSLGVLK